ncbi:protoheme IX farnesyltransferase, mitochondrial isoform X2 [Harpegnathos saltator]|uniref:protoheme IX farnesyltransferase, mitochondrial isoform X2 n=1 Tax=Harpegnathos saltator TaxID=610380 RepID=UPI00059147C7|nr:protoheme IX farnesyltransferase, mitochondrial isoform X2 [Harpegnathos saltator]
MTSVHSWKICRYIPCSSMSKYSVAMCPGSRRLKSTKTAYMEEPVQSIEDAPKLQVARVTPTIPFPVGKTVVHEIKKNLSQIQMSEWSPIIVDYTKLHKHYLKLSKIRLTSLVVATTMAGYALAPAPFDIYTFAMCSLGTGLVSAAANAINQFFEVPFDAQMSRTKNRVLVRGHLTSAQAVAFAAVSSIIGLSMLYYEVNSVTAALGATNLVLYTLIYTPMKRVSIVNTWVGSVVGAIPPLMGWAGCTGSIMMPGALIISGILYAWQFPHFNALSWNLRPDYSRAGYRMMAVTNPDLCRKTTMRYTVALTGLCYLAPVLDVTNWWFALATTPLNVSFLYLAWKFSEHSDSANSRKLFRFSLLHLPLLMMLMLTSKKYWSNTKKQEDKLVSHNEQETNLGTVLTTIAPATSSV